MARVLALALVFAGQVVAQEAPAEAETARPASPFSWRLNVEWITAVRGSALRNTDVNPENRVLGVPQWHAQSELRPNLRVEMGSQWQVVVRPRLLTTWDATRVAGGPYEDDVEARANWTELFASWRPHDAVAVTYGLQNFQWGPAELVSPSNRIFHEVGLFRDPLYYVRGKHLLRVNVSAGRQWSLVTLAELGANGEPPFEAGHRFARKGQAKLEWTDAAGASYVGVTAGVTQDGPPSVGGYGSLALSEGWSIYADLAAQRGSRAWYPVVDEGRPGFRREDDSGGPIRWHVLGGARYTFASGVDARAEYVHQDAGYTKAQLRLAALAFAAAPNPAAAEPYMSPGLEFLGRRLALVSVRVPDLPPSKRLEVQGRYLASLTDGSGVAFVTASAGAADRVTLFASAALTHGAEYAELARLVRGSLVGGVVWSW
jgi:hypothetical protein